MYSSLRYLFPAQASGDPWSSRLAKMEMRGVLGVVLEEESVVSGWMGEGSGYKMGWRGIELKVGGSWMGILLFMVV